MVVEFGLVFEGGANDGAIGDAELFLNIFQADAGIGKDGGTGNGLFDLAQRVGICLSPGRQTGDAQGVDPGRAGGSRRGTPRPTPRCWRR